MNLVKIIILSLILTFGTSKILYAESHDTTKSSQTITSEEINIEEINEEINIETDEEDVPLNDPFAGNAGASATTSISQTATEEQRDKMSLYNFKLVGIISGYFQSYVSLVNASGEVISLGIFEELSDGVKLVDMGRDEAVFQKADGKYLIINFKNQIIEKDDYYAEK